MNFLDGIIQGIFGSPTAEMTAEEGERVERQREGKRRKAGDMAVNAMNNPGEEFMPENLNIGGGDLLESIGKIFKMFQGG